MEAPIWLLRKQHDVCPYKRGVPRGSTWLMLRMKLGVGVGLGWGGVGMITFFALAHMVGATQHHVSCTCTHGLCYATSFSLHLHAWSVLRNIMFLALAHMVGATQHHFPCTCTHGRCYATSCFLHLHTWSVLRNIMFLGDEVCKERRDSYVLTAGDNCAESLCAVSKKQLRRTNLNIAVVRDKIEHRYLLSSHWENKAPGLARIMQALRCHKMKCMSGLVSPTDAFKKFCGNSDLRAPRKKGWLSGW